MVVGLVVGMSEPSVDVGMLIVLPNPSPYSQDYYRSSNGDSGSPNCLFLISQMPYINKRKIFNSEHKFDN